MVGSVQGGDVLEFASLDPARRFIFYTLDIHQSDQPRFDRRDVCLQCHQGPATLGVPGIMVASVYPDASGMPAFNLGVPVTDDRASFQARWGGWYVTGTHGGMHHRGNAVARDRSKPDVLEWHLPPPLRRIDRRGQQPEIRPPFRSRPAQRPGDCPRHQTEPTRLLEVNGKQAAGFGVRFFPLR
jgi:hypothetical protein